MNDVDKIPSKALILLEALKQTSTGAAIHAHVSDIINADDSDHLATQQAYLNLLNTLLASYQKHLPDDSPLYTHLKLIQLRLTPPLSASEINRLDKLIGQHLEQYDNESYSESMEEALSPLVEVYSNKSYKEELQAFEQEEPLIEHAVDLQTTPTPRKIESDRRVDVTYRKHLDDKRERIQKIQETLARHVNEVIKQNEEFGNMLDAERETLHQTDDIEGLKNFKDILINKIGKLKSGHYTLADKLKSANKYLQIIENEGKHLDEELTRVHILSLTDELTDLPNRRAFSRRLEDEVARVQRYGYPLTLCLIDLDGFKAINDQLGHAAGDEVLRNFATNILSTFRHHDMVARYGGEEFAVLLPNTSFEGALRALKKIQARASECPFTFDGTSLPMPTFSAGISLYKPGETPGSFIEHADKALYKAKNKGRNRIELAIMEVSESLA